MFNQIKHEHVFPDLLNNLNITTIPKRGPRLQLKNERGIFNILKVRYILMRLIYNRQYSDIDSNISGSQMDGRKRKGSKNNIFILNGLIHEVTKSKHRFPTIL